MSKIYQWNIKSLSKGVDPDEALNEIQRAESLMGKITAETVLAVASDESSPIHPLFEWDDSKAGHMYRLSQARSIINNIEVKVISDDETRVIPVFEIVASNAGQSYKHIEVMTVDERKQVIQSTISMINVLKNKIKVYKDLDKVVDHLNSALDALSSEI